MKEIGTRIFDDLGIPPEKRRYAHSPEASHHRVTDTLGRMGFHIPPFNSVNHLHLHLHALPYRKGLKYPVSRGLKYLISKGWNGKSKGFSWFIEVDQAIEILQQGKAIGVLPC